MKKFHSAFSLIELSIVILIIGILIAGVTQGSRLASQMRLRTASAQTQSSPISSIADLTLWLESTSKNSFDNQVTEDTIGIPAWYDINPQKTEKYNATQTTTNKQAKYSANAINGLPAVKFDGTDDDFSLGNFSADSNVSMFFVIKPTTSHVEGLIDSSPGVEYTLRNYCESGCSNDGQFSWWNSGTAPAVTLGLTALTPAIIYIQTTFDAEISPARTLTYYQNGTLISNIIDTTIGPVNWSSPRIGSINNTLVFYDGFVGEIVIFSHALKTEERNSVTAYLGKKWGIKTN